MQISSLSALQYGGEGAYLVYAAGMPIYIRIGGIFQICRGYLEKGVIPCRKTNKVTYRDRKRCLPCKGNETA